MKKNERIKKLIVIISLISFFLQVIPYHITIDNIVSAEPDVIDNGDNTMTATWDFFNPNDYIFNNTTMAAGEVNLDISEFWWNQTSQGDFNSPGSNFVNTTATISDDISLISTQNTTNLLENGSFSPSLPDVWNYVSSANITSKWNMTSESAEMNLSYITAGPNTVSLTPPLNQWDGYVYWDTISPGYKRSDSDDRANVGYQFFITDHFYYRAFYYFNISSVPDSSEILDVVFYLYLINTGGPTHETDIHALENESSQTDENLYLDCANGTLYIEDSIDLSSSASLGGFEFNLGGIGKSDIKDNLTRDWFGLGLHEEGDDDSWAEIGTLENFDPNKRPRLNITYSESSPITYNETAYINQTFIKTRITPDIPEAVNLSFEYALENINNVDDAKLIIEIDGQRVWIHDITGDEGWNQDYAHIGNYMTEARTYDISLQLQANVSSADTVICQAKFDNLNITILDFFWDGIYTSIAYDTGSEVLWDEISWDYTLPPDTNFSIRTCTSMDNISWSDWSEEYTNYLGQLIMSPTGRYIQYTINLSTTNYQNTPLLHEVSISFWKYRMNGTIEMMDDYIPGDYISAELVNWGDFVRVDQTFGDNINITYWYTINSGLNWTEVPSDGNLSNVPTSSGMIRFKAIFTSNSSSISPTLFKWNLTYIIGEAAGLEGDVDPGFGYITTWFNFTVNYSDPEDDAPLNDIVTLNITDGPSSLGIQNMFPLDPNDDNYMDGKFYYFNTTGFERGKYTFHYEAQDEFGFWSISGPRKFQVINSPPKIITTNDQGADEQELYYVNYTATDLEDEDNLTWSHSSNATWLSMNPTTGELQGIPTSADKGYYWVKVTVSDGHGGLDWTNFTLWVGDDILPIADGGFDDEVFKDSPYTFNGTNSWDNSGILNLNYTWFFGDGSKGYGSTPTHVYNQSGLHNVFLFVTDPSGNDDWAMVNITVKNSLPIADAGPDQTVNEGETVFFDGSNSYDTVSDIDSLIYRWDFDEDGNFKEGITSSHTWYNEDEVTVTFHVRDRELASDTDTMIVTIQNVAPSVDIEDNYEGSKGSDITFIAFASDPGNDILLFQWDWENDGVWDTDWSSDIIVKHTWSTIGTYNVKVRVSDGVDYDEDTAVVNITERKEPPIIGNLGIVQVRYNDPYIIDLANYVSDADTDLEDLIVWTNDTLNITVNGLKITLNYSEEARGQTIKVNIFVSDGDQFDNSTLGIEVTANYPPTLVNPIPDVEFYEDNISLNVFNLNHYFEDSDGEELEFIINYTTQYLTVIKDENGWITFLANPNWAGTELVIFRAVDPNGAYKEDMILVSVIAVNDAPLILGQIKYTTLGENENWTINLNRYFIDIDSPLEFSCNEPEIEIDQLNGTATWIPGRKKELNNVIFSASDGKYNVSLDPVDLKVFTPTPFNWLLVILPFILGLLAFAIYREVRYRYTIEEVFLVDNAGVLLVHMSRGESKAIDAKLVSGMLTAVQEFVKDSFRGADEAEDTSSEEGALGKLEYGDFQIVMERGSYTFLSAVISGYDNKRLRKRMRDVVDEFEKQYKDILVDWDGDMSKFDGADKIVGTLLKQAGNSNMSSDSDESEVEDMGFEDAEGLPFGDLSDVPSSYDDSEMGNNPEGGFGDSQQGSESSIKNKDKDMSDSMEPNEENSYPPPPPD